MREGRWFIPEEGLGYAFGVVGLSLMTLLLFYPLRKRARFCRSWGRLSNWFEVHMLFGLLGPLAILYHANFRLGSLNANIALAATLIVAASGIVGRVIYGRIYEQLSGRRRTLAEMRDGLDATRLGLEEEGMVAGIKDELLAFERGLLETSGRGLPVFSAIFVTPWRARAVRRRILRALGTTGRRKNLGEMKVARETAIRYISAVRAVADFGVYEFFFGLWHVAHLPLAFLLYVTALIHVMAVHMY
jgi:hypothetical protein